MENCELIIDAIRTGNEPNCTYDQLVELIFPHENAEHRNRILWEKTGFLGFFRPKGDEKTSAQVLLRQLLENKDNLLNKKDNCARCGAIIDISGIIDYNYFDLNICDACKTRLSIHAMNESNINIV